MSKEKYCDRLKGVPFAQYSNCQPHQSGTVTQGTAVQTRVFYVKLPETCRGFLKWRASNWQAGVVMTLYVDGERVQDYRRVMGEMEDPDEINPPLFVFDKIEVFAVNTGTADWAYDIYLDGLIYHDPRPEGI